VGAEIIARPGVPSGLGYSILVGQQNLQAMRTIGAMVLIGIIGASFDYGICRVEDKVAR
jgi:ABC-type nitrate/sulfonate/bicarbonate transport system permease component